MAWTINVLGKAEKFLEKMDGRTRLKIQHFINEILPNTENPRDAGKALQGNLKGLWRYRVGDYRIICQIKDSELTILVIEFGHHKDIYK